MNKSSKFHHALPAILSDKQPHASVKAEAKLVDQSDIDEFVAKLKETYFDDINSLPTKSKTQASSQPIENTE